MKKHIVFLVALLLVLVSDQPSRTQETAATLGGLKQEAISEVDKLQVLTQQMVDQIYSYSGYETQDVTGRKPHRDSQGRKRRTSERLVRPAFH